MYHSMRNIFEIETILTFLGNGILTFCIVKKIFIYYIYIQQVICLNAILNNTKYRMFYLLQLLVHARIFLIWKIAD